MKVELENILDIGTTLYSLDENFKIKRKVVVNIRSVFEQNVSHSPEIHTTYKVSNTIDELRSLGKLSPQDDIKYSIEYKDSIVPLQESIGEDATTATYKKTYKFIGIW